MRDYRSYFKRFLEGGVLSESFVWAAKDLPTWGRVVLRHYLNWLLRERRIDSEFVGWALKVVKSHSYGQKRLRVHEIGVEEVRRTLDVFKKRTKRCTCFTA